MEIAIKILQFVMSLSLLVLIHELGHYLFARMFGIRVEKFYLFFDPWFSLFKFNYKGTEYGIGWLPLGGYVKIAGMIDESMDTEQMKQPAKPDEFRSKPAWQRLLVMVGGVMMNVILAVIVYIGMSFTWGDTYIDNKDVKDGYAFSTLGHDMGFRNGDKILSVNGEEYGNFTKILTDILLNQSAEVVVLRGDSTVKFTIAPEYTARLIKEQKLFMMPRMPFVIGDVADGSLAADARLKIGDRAVALDSVRLTYFDEYRTALDSLAGSSAILTVERDSANVATLFSTTVNIDNDGKIGVGLAPADIKTSTRSYTFAEAIPAGVTRTGDEISSYWKQVKLIFTPETEAYKSLGGFIAIGNIFPSYWSWETFWRITAFLSIILAVMNILPIPALDGGHVLFLLYEVVSRRTPSDKFLERAQVVGIVILFALMIYANGNDIYRVFFK